MLFSVIVPCYNIEKYVGFCVQSILEQSFKNFELILVDDGSMDKTPIILDDFAKMDKRIIVIHKKNGGLTSARKAGTKIASGKYIIPIDGDDWIEKDYLTEIAKIVYKYDVDVICCGYFENGDNKKSRFPLNGESRILNKKELEKEIYYNLFRFPPNVWAKVFRKKLYLKYQMTLDDKIIMGEDGSIVYPLLLEAQSIYYLKKCFYNYRINNSSLTKSKHKYISWENVLLRIKRYEKTLSFNSYNLEYQFSSYVAHALFNAIVTHLRKESYFIVKKEYKNIMIRHNINHYLKIAQKSIDIKEKIAAIALYNNWLFFVKLWSVIV